VDIAGAILNRREKKKIRIRVGLVSPCGTDWVAFLTRQEERRVGVKRSGEGRERKQRKKRQKEKKSA
jgi:hypothetical protein